jgi:glycosyltransferase involved in cell wall biosynthesis
MVQGKQDMKILTMCQDIKKGGFYERYLSLTRAMLEQGWEVHYISTQRFPIKSKNLHYHSVKRVDGLKSPFFAKFMPQAMVRSLALANKIDFDRIVVFGSAYAFIGWALKKIHNIPMITFLRADLIENLKIQGRNKLVKPVSVMQRFAFKASDRIIVNTPVVEERTHKRYGIPMNKIVLIRNDIPRAFREAANVKRGGAIGFVGVLEKRKGIDTLLKAYAANHDKIGRRLVVVGSGPMDKEIKDMIKEKGLNKKVELMGWKTQSETKNIISSLSLLVVPSLSEGCPNTVLEALGCNTPCIGSDIDEIRDILSHKELLFKPDDPDDMVKRILYALKNNERVKRLSSERRKNFIFDWENMCIDTIRS